MFLLFGRIQSKPENHSIEGLLTKDERGFVLARRCCSGAKLAKIPINSMNYAYGLVVVMLNVDAVMTGTVKPFGIKGEPSGFLKTVRDSAVKIGALGLEGDEQADLKHHGGVDKAVMHYDYGHYAQWLHEAPHLKAYLQQRGAFGENISTTGMNEQQVCIGDQYRLGTAVVEVSQGRQPCWKINRKFDDDTMLAKVTSSVRCGWYYRVIEDGVVQQGDTIELLNSPFPMWTVTKVFGLLVGGDKDLAEMKALCELSVLSESWLERAHRRSQMLEKSKSEK